MLGFFTVVSLIVAWNAGGWWWLLFVIFLAAWVNKQDVVKKAAEFNRDIDPSETSLPTMHKTKGNSESILSKSNEWISQLTEICARFSCSDYYVDVLIPKNKLENALKKYPLQNGGKVIALIDTTVFGSADNGMLIWEHGISWHNSHLSTKQSTLKWRAFSELALSIDGSKIMFGKDAVFDSTGSQFSANKILSLLSSIDALLDQDDVKASDNPVPVPNAISQIDVNKAPFDTLLTIPGIGAAEAKLLLKHRESGKSFSSIDEVAELLNLKPHIALRLDGRLLFSQSQASHPPPAPASTPLPEFATAQPTTMPHGRTID